MFWSHAQTMIRAALADTLVVLVTDARQTGKTTLYAGERALPFGENLYALPIDALWR